MIANEPAVETRELESLPRHAVGAAYRMLGSVSEAEDVAQGPDPDRAHRAQPGQAQPSLSWAALYQATVRWIASACGVGSTGPKARSHLVQSRVDGRWNW